ncbi:MAG: bactofilin family protein [Brevinemataceae bacterium]
MPHRIVNTTNIIGSNSIFEGKIKLNGELRIDGKYKGTELNIQNLIVGKQGTIHSDIKTECLTVEGTICGNIISRIRAMFLPTAKILGNISTPELIIQHGVILEGLCRVSPNPDKDNIKQLIEQK